MSEQKRYTADEMREQSEIIEDCGIAAMLRQAADVKRSSMVDRYDRILRAARGEGGES